LRAWYGESGDARNGYGYEWLPKIVGDHSQLPMTLAMLDGTIRGLLLLGQNPVVGGHNSRNVVQPALAKLEWLVVRDTHETETASFWYASDAVKSGALSTRDIATEVFLMPASIAAGEKSGTFTNTHRLLQWHDQIVDAPGDSRSELWFIYHLGQRLKALYGDSDDAKDAPIRALTWDYPVQGEREEPSAEAVLKEINGYTWPERRLVSGYTDLKDDGSTACGVWIYSGVYPEDGVNKARSRQPDKPDGPGTHLDWGFAWPGNRRTMYNRASADAQGRPWSEAKKLVWWDEENRTWTGKDKPDFVASKPPDYEPDRDGPVNGMDALSGRDAFVMIADGKSSLFVPAGLKDAPLPAHYEPVESPVRNPLYAQQDNPTAKKWHRDENIYHAPADARYPHVLTTYRLTEHHSGGTPTRSVASTAELQPEGFAEIPPELARELGVSNLDWVVLHTARGEIETRALVTERLRPFEIDGRRVYQIGMPWHFGYKGYATGAIANDLSSVTGDPNTSIHEGKALTCGLRKGRLARERTLA
jgi:formate dehydrogenase major subunit